MRFLPRILSPLLSRLLDAEEEKRIVDDYLERVRSVGDSEGELSAHFYAAWLARLRGDAERAGARARRAAAMSEEARNKAYAGLCHAEVGLSQLAQQSWGEAAESFALAQEHPVFRTSALAGRGLAEYRLGRRELGLELSARSLVDLARRGWMSLCDAHVYLNRARLLISDDPRGHHDEIVESIHLLVGYAESSGSAAEAPLADLARAELAEALGDEPGRASALAAARAGFRAAGATAWLERLS